MPLLLKLLRKRPRLVGRLQQILRVLARHGFYRIVKRLSLHYQLTLPDRLRYARLHQEEDRNTAIHLRQACEELGPSFVEFGQLLSTRPDLIPEAFAKELSFLLAHTRPEPWEVIQHVIENMLPVELLDREYPFQEIHPKPLAAASIAQIHRATLKNGAEVILKIQRPGIDKLIAADLAILRFLAPLVERYFPESRSLNPAQMVEEFAVSIDQELDFIMEGTYMDRFSRIFADDPHILAPKVYWELSTLKVLVMEYIEGIPLYELPFCDKDRLRQDNINLGEVAQHLLRTFLKQIFLFGFFHADPHPGNFLVLPNNRIAFIDFGLMGQISQGERQTLAKLFEATLAEDYERVAKLWLDIAHAGADIDVVSFRRGLEKILGKQMNLPYERIHMGEMFLQMVQNGARHGLKLPRELYLLFRTLAEIEGLLYLLHPGFNAILYCREFAQEQEAAAREPARLAQATGEELQQWAGSVWRLPREVEDLVKKLTTGRLSVDFVHQGLDHLIGELDRSSNRLVFGLIVTALIVGSSLLILAEASARVWELLPFFGLTVFIIGCLLGIFLIILIWRSGKY
jgi:ubiquinone biosynthesis protein